ncbi:MAG: hypothetical protein JKY20_01585 [Alphaproteobacteria bacterium]|nr:hypothetical protein [Alphaproteobacteria bacterium]
MDGQQLPSQFHQWRFSSDGFEWGYDGTGPSQLAFAILADHFGDEFKALKSYKLFRDQVIVEIQEDEWEFKSSRIEQTLNETIEVAMTLEELMNKVRGKS